jgi:hypothetical protein
MLYIRVKAYNEKISTISLSVLINDWDAGSCLVVEVQVYP